MKKWWKSEPRVTIPVDLLSEAKPYASFAAAPITTGAMVEHKRNDESLIVAVARVLEIPVDHVSLVESRADFFKLNLKLPVTFDYEESKIKVMNLVFFEREDHRVFTADIDWQEARNGDQDARSRS